KFGNCLRTYSKWFYTELLNEINLSEIKEDLLSSIELLKKMQLKQFSTEKFELFYRNNKKQYGFRIKNPRIALSTLYKLGVLGNVTFRNKSKTWNGNSFFDKFYKVQNFFPYAIPIVLDNEPPRM
ncbi:TPA: hypothetical protein ACGBE2_002582, partial [Enterococcus faecium]